MSQITAGFTEENPKRNTLFALEIFWLGFIIYAAGYSLNMTHEVKYTICVLLQVSGLVLLISSAAFLVKLHIENTYLTILYFLYLCWSVVIIIRGFKVDYESVNQMLFDAQYGLFLYLVPLIILFPNNVYYFRKTLDVIAVLCIIHLVLDLFFYKHLLYTVNIRSLAILEYLSQQLSLAAGFLLLTFTYHSKRRIFLALFILVFTFVAAAIKARRGLMFMTFSMLIFSYFMFMYLKKARVMTIMISIILISAVSLLAFKAYYKHKQDTFGLITEKITIDTRTNVEQSFYRDMDSEDFLVGRGIKGSYYCPGINEGVIFRDIIETGYLQIILKGGIISLGLLLLIAVPAMIKGIFFSKNTLSKAAGIWIFFFLVFSYPATITTFTMHYILVWISIGICYSRRIRNIPEDELREILQQRISSVRIYFSN